MNFYYFKFSLYIRNLLFLLILLQNMTPKKTGWKKSKPNQEGGNAFVKHMHRSILCQCWIGKRTIIQITENSYAVGESSQRRVSTHRYLLLSLLIHRKTKGGYSKHKCSNAKVGPLLPRPLILTCASSEIFVHHSWP